MDESSIWRNFVGLWNIHGCEIPEVPLIFPMIYKCVYLHYHGMLAQLVQSTASTRQGSLVRAQYVPQQDDLVQCLTFDHFLV